MKRAQRRAAVGRRRSRATSSWRRRPTSGRFRPERRDARRAPGAVPGRAARPADPPLHVLRRPGARPVHGLGHPPRSPRSRTGRHFVGYDTDPAYVERALARVRRNGRGWSTVRRSPSVQCVMRQPLVRSLRVTSERGARRRGLGERGRRRRSYTTAASRAIDSPAKLATGIEVTYRAVRRPRDAVAVRRVGRVLHDAPGAVAHRRALARAREGRRRPRARAGRRSCSCTTDLPARSSAGSPRAAGHDRHRQARRRRRRPVAGGRPQPPAATW